MDDGFVVLKATASSSEKHDTMPAYARANNRPPSKRPIVVLEQKKSQTEFASAKTGRDDTKVEQVSGIARYQMARGGAAR